MTPDGRVVVERARRIGFKPASPEAKRYIDMPFELPARRS
jgi:hypothetical protein